MAEGGNGQKMENAVLPEKTSALDSFFVKQRRELMFEIRGLKHSNKPVTEGESKQNIEKFFAKRMKPDEHSDDEYERPENVLLDIGGLFESRPVSNLLRSMRFRQELESVVRGTVNRQDQEMERAQRLRVAGLAMAAAAAEHFSPVETLSETSASITSQQSDSRLGFAPPIPPPPPFTLNSVPPPPPQMYTPSPPVGSQVTQQQFDAWMQFQQFLQFQQQTQQHQPQQQWQQQQQPQWQQQQQQRQQQPQSVGAVSQPPQSAGVLPQQPWLLRTENQQNTPHVVHLDTNRREEFISDISSLVQQQLVSSTLESNFRGRLEYLLGDRLANGEFDGQRVSAFVQSIRPSRRIQRNDFRHLGINAPRPQQQTQEETLPSLEFESLRRQMDELKNMVQLTFDLQMDMQRAIRQEVAAALTGHSGTAASMAQSATQPANEGHCLICLEKSAQSATQPANEGHCLICLEKSIDSVLYQCGHMCVCLCCGLKLKSQGNNCPMCRAPIRDVIRAYRCHDE